MDPRTREYYREHAEKLVESYASFSRMSMELLLEYDTLQRAILDVGCGTGRDLKSLIDAGVNAYGVDASPEMVAAAVRFYRIDPSRINVEMLPELVGVRPGFSGVLCRAVLQHLRDDQLEHAFKRLRGILDHSGILVLDVPMMRAGVSHDRDESGRFFRLRDPGEYSSKANACGLTLLHSARRTSTTADGVWEIQVYRR